MSNRPRRAALQAPVGALVHVLWLDADSGSGATWSDAATELATAPSIIETVGWKVGTTAEYLVTASDRCGTTLGNIGRIPLSWVTALTVIEEPSDG